MAETPRAFVFDVFGTVVDWRSGVAREAAVFLAQYGKPGADPAEFADAWRRRYAPSMEEIRSGRRPYVRLDVLHRENLSAILPEFCTDPSAIPAPVLDALNFAWHRLDPWPDAVPGLTRLKSKFVIAPLSNGNISLMVNMAKRAGLPWDAILGAELAGTYKPKPEVYLNGAACLGLQPAQLCMVAAHNSDLEAARACGLATCFIARPHEHGPGQTTDLTQAADWDWVCADIGALASQLGV